MYVSGCVRGGGRGGWGRVVVRPSHGPQVSLLFLSYSCPQLYSAQAVTLSSGLRTAHEHALAQHVQLQHDSRHSVSSPANPAGKA